MTISRGRLNTMNFGDVASGRRLAAVHPGTILMKDFIMEMSLTRYRVAKQLGIDRRQIYEICAGERKITAETALRLARLFGTEATFWMSLQIQYDLETAKLALIGRIEAEVTPLAQKA